ncbi:nuclear transport factor 2 family protein [Salinibacterium sp. GXW1014]|uniref:nuclear transport factor 2 family protein n=1 Tax=Salinibacterium sp. GXW1014 TaxID=3377838 RepID=UPI00383B1151
MRDAESRRELVLRVFGDLTSGRILAGSGDALDALIAPEARHHGSPPSLVDGPAGARQRYRELHARMPGVVATVKRTVADGDLVGVHWHAATDPSDEFSGESWCEFFRFVGDQVAEHWQLHVDVPPSTVSGRSVFSDAYRPPAGMQFGGPARTATNREAASAAFARFLDFDPTVVADHWDDVYLQHNESIPDGPEALRRSLEEIGSLPEHFRPSFTVIATAAEGDLVWFLERVRVGGESGFGADIFRLVDGRIVEHWDVPALRPRGGGAGSAGPGT